MTDGNGFASCRGTGHAGATQSNGMGALGIRAHGAIVAHGKAVVTGRPDILADGDGSVTEGAAYGELLASRLRGVSRAGTDADGIIACGRRTADSNRLAA